MIKPVLNQKVQDEIKHITAQLIEKYHPQKIILFGSAAWAPDEFNQDSDLDFFIIKDDVPVHGHDRSYQLRRLLEYDIACDLLVARQDEVIKQIIKEDPFVEKILQQGQVLYG